MNEKSTNVIQLVGLKKRFETFTAVDGINLDIPRGEFFSMLGPSGCGKTTTLRLIAGFERPDEGQIALNGERMEQVPPHKRPVNTVFQNYALFPHLNLFDNVAYGLRRKRLGKKEIERQAGEALDLVKLQQFRRRKPSELSGGQQQRVALARALVLKPAVLLLDEPLSALDAKLRKQMQVELKALQEQVGITFIFVTHDQNEALSMSDRIAVMKDGRIEQVGTPHEIYQEPGSSFVADFLGAANLLDVTVSDNNGMSRCWVNLGGQSLTAACADGAGKGPAKIIIHPERVCLERPENAGRENRLAGRVERSIFMGNKFQLIVALDMGATIEVDIQNTRDQATYEVGARVSAWLPAEDLRVLPSSDEASK